MKEMELLNALLVSESRRVKELRISLEKLGYYDSTRRIAKLEDHDLNDDSGYAIPLTPQGLNEFDTLLERGIPLPHPFEECKLIRHTLPLSRKQQAKEKNIHDVLHTAIEELLDRASEFGINLTPEDKQELISELPTSWERHGDLVVLPSTSFVNSIWGKFITIPQNSDLEPTTKLSTPPKTNNLLWDIIASILKCKRLTKDNKISCDGFRTPGATLLLGEDGWVEHIDNGVKYIFDVTKCMFSSGNVSEKIRVARFECSGETVVDLYVGVGYFTLPYLVHCKAEVVHACEWNQDAVEGLRRGLVANGVAGKCVVHVGDCRKLSLQGVADRVNLGLVPSSEGGWPVACAALKRTTGGWLHIHGNVSTRSAKGDGCHGDRFGIEGNPWEVEDRGRILSSRVRVKHLDHVTQPGGHVTHQRDHMSQHDNQVELSDHVTQQGDHVSHQREHVTQHNNHVTCENVSEHDSLQSFKVEDHGIEKDEDDSEKIEQKVVEVCSSKKRAWQSWGCYVAEKIHQLLCEKNGLEDLRKTWSVRVDHIEHVKSYAPHVDHLVADVECRPIDR